jgi:hypothetical protein
MSQTIPRLNEVRFYLPKQLLHFTVTYDVYKKKATAPANKPNAILVAQSPVKLALVSVPDKNLGFIADYNDIQGLVTDATKMDLNLTDNQCFKSLNAEYDDQLLPIISETVASAIKVGKAVASFAAAASSEALYAKTDNPITIDATIDLDDAITGEEAKALLKQQVMAAQAKAAQENQPFTQEDENAQFIGMTTKSPCNDQFFNSVQGAIYRPIFPRQCMPKNEYILNGIYELTLAAARANGLGTAKQVMAPKFKLFLDKEPISSTEGQAAELLKATGGQNDTRGYQMIVTRAPETAEFILISDLQIDVNLTKQINSPACVLDQVSQFSQTGGFTAFEIRRHTFTNAGYGLTCNDAGAITESNSTRTSTLKSIADALKTITDAL